MDPIPTIDVDGIYKEFRGNLIGVCFDFKSKPLGIQTPEGPKILLTEGLIHDTALLQLRDSVIYRANSLRFHINLLEAIIKGHSDDLKKDNFGGKSRGITVHDVSEQSMYLFDDLVFNSISLYDYFSGFIGYILDGEHGKKADWDKIVKICYDVQNVHKTNFAKKVHHLRTFKDKVIEVDKNRVKKLMSYRGILYHNKNDIAHSTGTQNLLDTEKSFYFVEIPELFAEQFQLDNKGSISDAAKWVAKETYSTLNKVIDSMRYGINYENQEYFKKTYPPNHPIWGIRFVK
jgi:hypothetical protein